jgi:hypothetical protein
MKLHTITFTLSLLSVSFACMGMQPAHDAYENHQFLQAQQYQYLMQVQQWNAYLAQLQVQQQLIQAQQQLQYQQWQYQQAKAEKERSITNNLLNHELSNYEFSENPYQYIGITKKPKKFLVISETIKNRITIKIRSGQ